MSIVLTFLWYKSGRLLHISKDKGWEMRFTDDKCLISQVRETRSSLKTCGIPNQARNEAEKTLFDFLMHFDVTCQGPYWNDMRDELRILLSCRNKWMVHFAKSWLDKGLGIFNKPHFQLSTSAWMTLYCLKLAIFHHISTAPVLCTTVSRLAAGTWPLMVRPPGGSFCQMFSRGLFPSLFIPSFSHLEFPKRSNTQCSATSFPLMVLKSSVTMRLPGTTLGMKPSNGGITLTLIQPWRFCHLHARRHHHSASWWSWVGLIHLAH